MDGDMETTINKSDLGGSSIRTGLAISLDL